MEIAVKVVDYQKASGNLLLLTDKDHVDKLTDYLSEVEMTFVNNAVQKSITYLYLPSSSKNIIVQFLNHSDDIPFSKEQSRIAGNDILTTLNHYKLEDITIVSTQKDIMLFEYIEGILLGGYKFLKYKKYTESKQQFKRLNIDKSSINPYQLHDLLSIIKATYIARDLVNEPSSYLSALQLGEDFEKIGEKYGFSVKTLHKEQIESLKMGGLLAVNKGSFDPPIFSVMEWKPNNPVNQKPIVLVGKGIVFDTGGINLKPNQNSLDIMKCDMAGAATVIGAMVAASKAQLPLHIIGLVPSTDNRPGSRAFLPGDIITMFDGTTVEVINTDAEGRLVLADALHYAKKYNPELVLDFATLTGDAIRACGKEGICYMGNASKDVKTEMEASGADVHERLLEFPLWKEYADALRSSIADLRNMGGPTAGTITAGKFLEHFTDFPWLHFDMGGMAFLRTADGYRTKDATGVGVRLLYRFFKNYCKNAVPKNGQAKKSLIVENVVP